MTVAPHSGSALYSVAETLTPFDLKIGDQIEAITPQFYNLDDLVLAQQNGHFVIGRLQRPVSRYRVHVPAFGDNAEQNYDVSRDDLLGVVTKVAL